MSNWPFVAHLGRTDRRPANPFFGHGPELGHLTPTFGPKRDRRAKGARQTNPAESIVFRWLGMPFGAGGAEGRVASAFLVRLLQFWGHTLRAYRFYTTQAA